MKLKHKEIRAYHIWNDEGELKGVEITSFADHRKLLKPNNVIEINGETMTYILTTFDDEIGYQEAVNFAIAHYNGLMQSVVLDLSGFNRIGQATRKGRKKPPATNRGVKNESVVKM
jgi:hypothetical protein